MKQALNYFFSIVIIASLSMVMGCNDPGRVFDQSTEISNRNWAYVNTIKYNIQVDDAGAAYNLYLNVRVSGDYKYANMFMLLHTSGPKLKPDVIRYELHLANAAGEWLGSGSGDLYSYQIPVKTNFHFPAKGTYHFEIEQNMRDNPLHEVSDVGMRLEKAK